MAVVRPFRAHTYARTDADITRLAAPPYDVVSSAQRAELLAGDPANVVALELAEGPLDPAVPGNRYEHGAAIWARWTSDGTLVRDEEAAVYVIEQRFVHHGHPVRRRAFVAAVDLEPFDAGVILPHERTLPKALADRLALLRAVRANTSQVFGLYHDPDGATDALFDAATAAEPVMRATDADGVESLVWAIADPEVCARLADFMADERIFIADGHHRYTVALAYRDERRAAKGPGGEYDAVMMALVNMDDPDLVVLPYNRMARAEGAFDRDAFYAALSERFEIADLPPGHPPVVLSADGPPSFIVKTRGDDRPRVATLRADVDLDAAITAPHSREWKGLDVAVLQELVLDPLLGVHPDRPETLDRLSFSKDPHETLAAVAEEGDRDVAFVLRPTRMDQMRAVALAGETMPQKSTYFYPKLLSGLLFRALD